MSQLPPPLTQAVAEASQAAASASIAADDAASKAAQDAAKARAAAVEAARAAAGEGDAITGIVHAASEAGQSASRAIDSGSEARRAAAAARRAANEHHLASTTGNMETARARAETARQAVGELSRAATAVGEHAGRARATVDEARRRLEALADSGSAAAQMVQQAVTEASLSTVAAESEVHDVSTVLAQLRQELEAAGIALDETSEEREEVAGLSAGETEASELKVLRRRRSRVAPEAIPQLPTPPPPASRSVVEGVVVPTSEPQGGLEALGRWRQTDASSAPDFLPGGYSSNVLTFREGGILEVRRTFGKADGVALTWRVGYEWSKDKKGLMLGKDKALRPPAESLKGFTVPGAGAVVRPPAEALPLTVSCTEHEDGTMRLGKKTYKRVEDDWEPFKTTPPKD